MYIRHPLKTSTIWYVSFHIRVRSVCDAHFPSFKTYAMFVTRIIFHLKRYVCDKHSLSFKTLVMFVTCIVFHLKRSYCSRRAIFFIQNVRNVRNTKLILSCSLHLAVTITFVHIFTSKFFNESLR